MNDTSPVLFSGGKPSNFYVAPIIMKCPVISKALMFDSNERYFHVCKIPLSDLTSEAAVAMARRIRTAPSSQEAKRLGRALPLRQMAVTMWDEQCAIVAMLTCNLAKYRRHEDCREWLLSTGDRQLIEHRPDKVWGDNMNGTGKNLLGKTLMLVRDVLR